MLLGEILDRLELTKDKKEKLVKDMADSFRKTIVFDAIIAGKTFSLTAFKGFRESFVDRRPALRS